MAGAVTLSDVAREAGVSLATASRAVNGSATRTVRADLRDRVLEAAQRLGYTPDANAQAMARGRTTSLGLVVHDIADPYYAAVAAGVTATADDHGLLVALASTVHRPEREIELVELMHRQRALGIIVAGSRLGDADQERRLLAALEAYQRSGGGVAIIGQPLGDLPTVRVDNAGGAAALARELVRLGYRDVAVAAGPAQHGAARARVGALVAELARHGVDVPQDAVVHGALTREGGREAAETLLARRPRPEVVVAATDLMAIGVLNALRDAGLRVPDDVAVTGFDDVVPATDVTPALTTVRLPLVEMGRTATLLALAVADGTEPARPEPVEGEVVLRGSTRQPVGAGPGRT